METGRERRMKRKKEGREKERRKEKRRDKDRKKKEREKERQEEGRQLVYKKLPFKGAAPFCVPSSSSENFCCSKTSSVSSVGSGFGPPQ